MSLSSAISSALSGLTAATRGTELVATNVSNKSVAGYARRELELSSRIHSAGGGGVSIDGVRRIVNAALVADNRLAAAKAGNSSVMASFHAALEAAFGTTAATNSLATSLGSLDEAITLAAGSPDSEIRLQNVLDAAAGLAGKINSIAKSIEEARSSAENSIRSDVDRLNESLSQVALLNRQIAARQAQGQDASSLVDARQAVIDGISGIVPIVEVSRENGRVAIYTKGGATLLDGVDPVAIEFTAKGHVTADMSVENGALAMLSVNGKALGSAEMGLFGGGTLAAHFEIRDSSAPAYQAQIDAFAMELYQRFADPGVDPTLSIDQHGLFTDAQGNFDAANFTGLANRIAVTKLADPAQGGEIWRIRAGLNATDGGDAGDGSRLLAMSGALSDSRTPSSHHLGTTARDMLGLASQLSSGAASNRLRSEARAQQDQGYSDGLKTALLADGVDTDAEMETLLALETAYAANAKVLQAANDMLDQILRLT
ncbi:flagellar hook-associated protein FlgK [Paracoccus sp. MBLB3053]|uniref:Flagellar hook-associated protein 1 n=1 Tax=Paracoccus aurantius TaxID=3073814 RepID=A0ABU2HPC0_9RHOB|nr:flagellar hook-associated protein FlgK [Paracoccus sp. MBLB3053]MDS9466893.1 flagellar hook-associated protein FlgK [Paracoccus sp. MBLB3053]